MSLTGDELTDRLVPVAGRLVCAVREHDYDEVCEALGEAEALAAGTTLDGAEALAVVLAAMVPWNQTPARLLTWWRHRDEFESLVKAGLEPTVAAEIIERRTTGGR